MVISHLLSTSLQAGDWPQFLGPDRNGSSAETFRMPWPAQGPRTVWTKTVGAGFAGPVVVGDRLLLHHRDNDLEVLDCLDAQRGNPLWRQSQPATYRDDFGFDPGPRASPAVASGRVVACGAAGLVTCVDLTSGRLLWKVDTARLFGARKGFFGWAPSPLVVNDLVLLVPGGPEGKAVVALNLEDGATRWTASDEEAGYASPVLATTPGTPRVLIFHREGLLALAPDTGQVLARIPFRSPQHASVNAATPLVLPAGDAGGPKVFLTASYGTGAAVFDLGVTPPAELWRSQDAVSAHYASVVHHQGTIFGFHGRQEEGPELRAIDARSGKVRWSRAGLGAGTLTLAGDRLLVLTERGELITAPASPTGFMPDGRVQILGTGTRAHPALARGHLFARDPRRLVCVRLDETAPVPLPIPPRPSTP